MIAGRRPDAAAVYHGWTASGREDWREALITDKPCPFLTPVDTRAEGFLGATDVRRNAITPGNSGVFRAFLVLMTDALVTALFGPSGSGKTSILSTGRTTHGGSEQSNPLSSMRWSAGPNDCGASISARGLHLLPETSRHTRALNQSVPSLRQGRSGVDATFRA